MHILMVAAENGSLPGAKVGGIGDVIRDVPRALAAIGHRVTVITPGYQALSRLPGARLRHSLSVEFNSALEKLELYAIERPDEPAAVEHLVLEHPLFAACGAGHIYCHDAHEPFATDAAKFALFCQTVGFALVTAAIEPVDVLHLHDWHAAPLLLLCRYLPAYRSLRRLRTVYTIHNLSLQGVRPLSDNWSSPARWYPTLKFPAATVADPQVSHCINLMRTGINLADRVHVVSPTYAREILEPSQPALGLVRGEGLEKDLRVVHQAGRLHGILNGCDYSGRENPLRKPPRKHFITEASRALTAWVGGGELSANVHFFAQQRLLQWMQTTARDQFLVAAIGRLTTQKVGLLRVRCAEDQVGLDALLQRLARESGYCILLGSGDPECELFMRDAMRRHHNFLFLCGYDEKLADMLYRLCDLFLMPSTFEPCGISQMLALRAGKPCLVHAVGGLADTVRHMKNGFTFAGADQRAQVGQMLAVFDEVLQLRAQRLPVWQKVCRNAAASRFLWEDSVRAYERLLYR